MRSRGRGVPGLPGVAPRSRGAQGGRGADGELHGLVLGVALGSVAVGGGAVVLELLGRSALSDARTAAAAGDRTGLDAAYDRAQRYLGVEGVHDLDTVIDALFTHDALPAFVAGTVGFPLPGVSLRVTDPATGAELPQGEIGMIEVKGPNVFKGYWRMPEKTASEFRADGFFITGDLGKVDERGYTHIVGVLEQDETCN